MENLQSLGDYVIGDDVEDMDDPVLLADQQLRDLLRVPGH